MEQQLEQTKTEITHDLIVAVINQGGSDELMDAAKAAGAGGGTVLNARRIGAEDVSKFFGITVQPEKEVVAILTERANKKAIMKAINRDCGLQTESRGIVFSLPVDGVAGLSSD